MASIPPTLRTGTPDLPDVPPFIQALIGVWLTPILAWATRLLYRQVLTRCADHPLIHLNRWFDPSAAIAACAGYHHALGTRGAPPTFSIAQFVRIEIVRAWADSCSDPALEELLATNLLVRWFVDLPLFGPTPDHSTLADFHAWMSSHAPQALFTAVLTFLDRVDPEPATTMQIVDTFAMASPAAASVSVAHLLAQLACRLHGIWRQQTPPPIVPPAVTAALTLLADLPHAYTPAARHDRLQIVVGHVQTVVAACTLPATVADDLLRHALTTQQQAIAKVIADDLTCTADGIWQQRTKCGAYRIGSAIDPEATFRKHDGQPAILGSNAVVSTTTTRIRVALALTGCTPDSLAPPAVLAALQADHQPLPAQLLMDQAGGWGKTRATVDAMSDGTCQIVARVPTSGGSDPNRFTVADFTIDADHTRCVCPNGVVSTRIYRDKDKEGDVVRFLASDCRGCPLWDRCREPTAKPKGHRNVTFSDYHLYVRVGAAFNHTDPGKALLRERWRVEPVIAWLVRYHGCRRARRIGLAAAQCQLWQACAVRNLLGWLSRMRRGLAPTPEPAP